MTERLRGDFPASSLPSGAFLVYLALEKSAVIKGKLGWIWLKGDVEWTWLKGLLFFFLHPPLPHHHHNHHHPTILINWDISHPTLETVAECSVRGFFFLLPFTPCLKSHKTHRRELSASFRCFERGLNATLNTCRTIDSKEEVDRGEAGRDPAFLSQIKIKNSGGVFHFFLNLLGLLFSVFAGMLYIYIYIKKSLKKK